jgi:hypothetical protein
VVIQPILDAKLLKMIGKIDIPLYPIGCTICVCKISQLLVASHQTLHDAIRSNLLNDHYSPHVINQSAGVMVSIRT